jgi:hypothetical protein
MAFRFRPVFNWFLVSSITTIENLICSKDLKTIAAGIE